MPSRKSKSRSRSYSRPLLKKIRSYQRRMKKSRSRSYSRPLLKKIRSYQRRMKKTPSKSRSRSKSKSGRRRRRRSPTGLNRRCLQRNLLGQCRGSTKRGTRCKTCARYNRDRYPVCGIHKKSKPFEIYISK